MCRYWRLRVTYVGELGWEFYCPMEYGVRLWDTLWEAGQPEGLVAAGYKAIDTLRLEKAYRYWSSEISPDYTPLEAGLGFSSSWIRAISWAKKRCSSRSKMA